MQQDAEKISSLANRIMALAHDELLVHLRFFDLPLAQLARREKRGSGCFATDGQALFYDPVYVLQCYQREPALVARSYLHTLLHCIFFHSFRYDKLDREKWDLAADIAVESTIIGMKLAGVTLEQDADAILLLSGDEAKYQAILAKNKEGRVGEIPLTFDKPRQRFLAVTSELEGR